MTVVGRIRSAIVRALPPAVVACGLAWLGHDRGAQIVGTIAVLLLVIGLVAPRVAAVTDRAVQRIEVAVVHGISLLLAFGAWVFVVLPVWAVRTAGGAFGRAWAAVRRRRPDPHEASAWVFATATTSRNPDGSAADPARSGSREPAATRSVAWSLIAAVAATAVLTAGLVAVGRFTGVGDDLASTKDGPASTTGRAMEWNGFPVDRYAHEDEPWAPAYFTELQTVPSKVDFMLGYHLTDFDGRYIKIVDGHRAGYTPRDPELTVWFFGGSTLFGIGQRDDHTIPSVVAKAAEADGLRIRAVNYGASGFLNWQSLEQFEQLLSAGVPPPDLAVFYEGINETGVAFERTELGDVRRGSISRFAISDEEKDKVRGAPDNTGKMDYDQAGHRNQVMEELASDQYRRGSMLIDALAQSYGVPLVRFWQPSPFAKVATPSDDELWERLKMDPAGLPDSKRRYQAVFARSGVSAIDLTTVLDGVDRPIYFDGAHTNELGARIVGNAIYRDIRPQLEQLAGR